MQDLEEPYSELESINIPKAVKDVGRKIGWSRGRDTNIAAPRFLFWPLILLAFQWLGSIGRENTFLQPTHSDLSSSLLDLLEMA